MQRVFTIPNQLISKEKKLKDKKWQRETMDFFIYNSHHNSSRRKSYDQIRHNRNYMNMALDTAMLDNVLNPLGAMDPTNEPEIDRAYTFYDIIGTPFDTLFGEELKRLSEAKAFAINPEVVNEKDKQIKKLIAEFLVAKAQEESVNKEQLAKELQKMDYHIKNDVQTVHEKMANRLIQSFWHDPEMRLKEKFNNGFQDLEVIGEEIFAIDNIGDDPVVRHVESENFYVYGLGASKHIEDAAAWMEVQWLPFNKIIEEFKDSLSKTDIKNLEEYYDKGPAFLLPSALISNPLSPSETSDERGAHSTYVRENEHGDFVVVERGPLTGDNYVDSYGNIRVVRVQWITNHEVGMVSTYDIDGNREDIYVDRKVYEEEFKGQPVKWVLTSELWKGVLIGAEKYIDVGPHDVQMRNLMNPTKVRPTYTGIIRTMSNGGVQSRLDRVKSYQDDFNLWMNKLKEIWANSLGKIAVIDASRIPSNMDPEEWWTWIKRFKLMYENPFEESKKGQVSGNMQQGNRTIDLSLAEEINQAITMLSWIEQKVNQLTAVPEPRQGNLTGNEGLGTSQQAIIQSSNQTEMDFNMHEYVKARVYELLIDYTKTLWKHKRVKRQYLLDDLSNFIIDINVEQLKLADIGVRITNTGRAAEMTTIIKNMLQPMAQAGTISGPDMVKILMSSSPSEMLHKMEEAEEKKMMQQREMEQVRAEASQQEKKMEAEIEALKHNNEIEKLNVEYGHKKEIELMKLEEKVVSEQENGSRDDNRDGVEDQVELDKQAMVNEVKEKEIESKEKVEMAKIKSNEKIKKDEMRNKAIERSNKPK